MPIDPNISLQVGNNVRTLDPLTAYGQVLTLKNAIDAQRLNSLQYDRTQRAMEDEQAVRGAYSVTPDGQVDEPATIRNLVTRGFGPQAVEVRNKFSTDRLANQKAEREAEKSQYEMLGKRIELVSQGLGALGENPTYEQAVQVGQWLNANGVKYDVAELPKDPEQLAAYIQQKRMQALTAKEQLAENAPTSPLGKLLRDQRRDQERTRALMAQDQASIEGQGQVDESGALVAPRINVAAPPDPYAPAIAREQYGPADAPFRYGKGGQIEGVPQVQDYRLAERKAGAQVNNVNVEGPRVDLGKPAMGKVDEGLLDTSAALMRMDRIGKNYQPEWSEFQTQAGMKLSGMAEKYLGVKMDPKKKESFQRYTAWRRNTLDNLNKGIKEATGSAMGQAEAERIIASMPSPDDSPTEFQQKLDDTVSQYRMAMARFTYIKRQGGNMSIEDVPLEKMPDIMRARDAELESASMRKYPDMDKSERDRLIKRQLAQEFGLVYK